MTRRLARHARRRPFPWGSAVAGVVIGAFVGGFIGAMIWDQIGG